MPADKPVVYILHGDDDYTAGRFIAQLIEKMGEPSMAELNTTRLDGRSASEDDLRAAALAMPFLADRRLVIVENPLARLERKRRGNGDAAQGDEEPQSLKKQREKYLALLTAIPETTALVLPILDTWVWSKSRRQMEWETLNDRHWLIKWAGTAGKRVFLREFRLPEANEMPAWIRKQAAEQGGQFNPQAAAALADHVGNDTRLAVQEIAKLLAYVDGKRAVDRDDVDLLVAPGGQASVFAMVDALGARDGRAALRLLRALEEEQDASMLFGMVVRQFRLILQARELLDEGVDPRQIPTQLRQSNFVAEKVTAQARRFSMGWLEDIYHQLLAIDEAAKTGQMPLETALETFVTEVAA